MPPVRKSKANSPLVQSLTAKGVTAPAPARAGPVWKGPTVGGVTVSLLNRYLTCKERFRLYVMEGLRSEEGFSHLLEYGNMWHVCEEALAGNKDWGEALAVFGRKLLDRYCYQQDQVRKWYNVCKVQFPEYVKFWEAHEDVRGRTPLEQEKAFRIPYRLPSGRIVFLRGKRDSVDLIETKRSKGGYLQENKTKGEIKEVQLQRQLTFDIQTMTYLTALHWENEHDDNGNGLPAGKSRFGAPILGVRYNVIRRPLSGGKGSIKQKEGETEAEYYGRLAQYIKDEPATYFMRWKVEVAPSDVQRFRDQFLDPILENLLDDYEWWAFCYGNNNDNKRYNVWEWPLRSAYFDKHIPRHYRHPFGVRNVLDEGGGTDLDEYLMSGSEVGLTRVENLFPELT